MNMYGDKAADRENFDSNVGGQSGERSPNTGLNIRSGDVGEKNLLELMFQQRWTILVTAGIFVAGAILYLIKAVPIYTSTSSVYVEQTGPKLITDYEGVMTRSKNYLNTQCEVIRSTPILAKVVENPEIQQLRTIERVDNPVSYLKQNLQVNIGRKDDIITVSLDSPYPEEAAQLVNKVVSEYINYHASQQRSTVSEVQRLLQKEKVKRDKELSEKFAALLEFTRTNGVTAFEQQGDHIVLRRLATLSDALTKAQLETISAKADLEAAEKMAAEPEKLKYLAMSDAKGAAAAISNSEEREIRFKLRELQQKLEEVRRQCTDEHPLVKELKAEIAALQEQLGLGSEEFADAYIEVLRQKYQIAKHTEEKLLVSFNEQQQEAQSLGLKATQYAVLQSELDRTEKLCDILDQRIKELNVTEDAGALNISILEVAQVEDRPSKPQRAKILAMALLVGLLFGCGIAILGDWLDYRLRSVEEISAILGVPVLGVIPKMAESSHATIVSRSRKVWLSIKRFTGERHRETRSAPGVARLDAKCLPTSEQNRRLITQLVMDCGKKMVSRLMPIIAEACKHIGLGIEPGQSRGGTASTSTEQKSESEQKENRGEKEKGWLESQATVAQVYQRRLDRALFGGLAKEAQPLVTEERAANKPPQAATETMSNHGLEILHKPRSAVAEAYRTIRTAVFFGVPKDEAKIILVTSPAPGDGKSTIVSNLAIATAQAGQKTLVLDCDFRKPTQHAIFNSSNLKGISNIFAENLSLKQAIQGGPVAGLDILTRGPEVPNPCELLNSTAFMEMLNKLSERYDRIIIDSAPVTAVSDSQILSAVSDVTILVLRAEKSTRRLSQLAMRMLLSVGARVMGAVVNCAPLGGGHHGYYYGYGYYGKYGRYGYGRDRKDGYYQDFDKSVKNTHKAEVKV
jgi:capsular exopolysaccharide synthesis family protein